MWIIIEEGRCQGFLFEEVPHYKNEHKANVSVGSSKSVSQKLGHLQR